MKQMLFRLLGNSMLELPWLSGWSGCRPGVAPDVPWQNSWIGHGCVCVGGNLGVCYTRTILEGQLACIRSGLRILQGVPHQGHLGMMARAGASTRVCHNGTALAKWLGWTQAWGVLGHTTSGCLGGKTRAGIGQQPRRYWVDPSRQARVPDTLISFV